MTNFEKLQSSSTLDCITIIENWCIESCYAVTQKVTAIFLFWLWLSEEYKEKKYANKKDEKMEDAIQTSKN